jgi:hypothetical protein
VFFLCSFCFRWCGHHFFVILITIYETDYLLCQVKASDYGDDGMNIVKAQSGV